MPSLPIELLNAIVDQVPPDELYNFRAASKLFNDIATPRIFRCIGVTNTLISAKAFGNVVKCQNIMEHVREVRYVENEDDSALVYNDEDVLQSLCSTFSYLDQIPALDTLTVVFEPLGHFIVRGSSETPRLDHQTAILTAIAGPSCPPKKLNLRTLTLNNLIPVIEDIHKSSSFFALFQRVTVLRLTILPELDIEGDSLFSSDYFWRKTTRDVVGLPALASNLTSLALCSRVDVGPVLFFLNLTYPCLTSLTLQSIIFNPVVGTRDFIRRHCRTLTDLELVRCKISMDGNTPPKLWAEVWDSFAEELGALVHLRVELEMNPAHALRYARQVGGMFLCYDDDQKANAGGDSEALERLREVVAVRRHSLGAV
ncbi:hypothetical protein BV25DRAFT_1838103 [Artomyces pyxidatus]|uniref:Uncharacterized protein n=1 Tax=Artomyces pyxidatus TaxID=48021 RepID=A0ACB8T1F1_9AGAM|nr:hypothetical protein BV25DRAFT_1838103 [Artomyces pyxidatus]